jgi:hypothetical protein
MTKQSQFFANATGSGFGSGDFLTGSLELAFADTRKGFDAPTQALVAKMTDYVAANPDTTNSDRFNKYVEKIQPTTAKATVAPRATAKPGSSM